MIRGRPRRSERDIAIADGRARYFTGVACTHGHICDRLVCNRHCIECQQQRQKLRPHRERNRRWSENNREKRRQYQRDWRQKNPQKSKAIADRQKATRKPRSEYMRDYQRNKYRKMAVALKIIEELGIQIDV